MQIAKKISYDYTATVRGARREQRLREQGGRRLTGWLDKERNDKLQELLASGYAPDITAVICKALDEAHLNLNK